jgi:pyruvate dehydrogenase E2 component (dihydrolipoyllysine-residue acetyltransferase)
MAKVMELPKLGVNMEKATIVEWIVQIGDEIEVDQYIISAETDKAVVEIPSTVAGILAIQVAQPGNTVKVGEPVAVFVERGEELRADFSIKGIGTEPKPESMPRPPSKAAAAAPTVAVPLRSRSAVPNFAPTGEFRKSTRVPISPLAKKTAKEMGIDYKRVQPSRPGVRVTKSDVLAWAEGLREAPAAAVKASAPLQLPVNGSLTVKDRIPLTGIRGTIAERLWMSTQATARAVLFTKVDMSQVNAWREDLKQQGHSVSINSLMVAVVAKALTEFPPFNARIENREIQLIEEINIGVAVDTARGLLVPTIRRANQRGVISIDLDLKEKVERAKAGKAGLEDLSGGTFTITNLGMFGVEAFIPIINPPEAAILALGEVEKKQVILDDNSVVIKPMVRLSLVWDHRLNDGAPAARFLQRIKELMEKPMGLMS